MHPRHIVVYTVELNFRWSIEQWFKKVLPIKSKLYSCREDCFHHIFSHVVWDGGVWNFKKHSATAFFLSQTEMLFPWGMTSQGMFKCGVKRCFKLFKAAYIDWILATICELLWSIWQLLETKASKLKDTSFFGLNLRQHYMSHLWKGWSHSVLQ